MYSAHFVNLKIQILQGIIVHMRQEINIVRPPKPTYCAYSMTFSLTDYPHLNIQIRGFCNTANIFFTVTGHQASSHMLNVWKDAA